MYYIEDIEKEKTIKQFETFDKLEMLLYIKNYLKENPESTLEFSKDWDSKSLKEKYVGTEVLNVYEINPNNKKPSLCVCKGDKTFYKPI